MQTITTNPACSMKAMAKEKKTTKNTLKLNVSMIIPV